GRGPADGDGWFGAARDGLRPTADRARHAGVRPTLRARVRGALPPAGVLRRRYRTRSALAGGAGPAGVRSGTARAPRRLVPSADRAGVQPRCRHRPTGTDQPRGRRPGSRGPDPVGAADHRPPHRRRGRRAAGSRRGASTAVGLGCPVDRGAGSMTAPPRPEPATATEPPLGREVGRGLGWSTLSNLVLRVGNFVVSLIMARLIAPEEFGVFAVALTVWSVLSTLAEFGLGSDLVRARDPQRRIPTVATLGL